MYILDISKQDKEYMISQWRQIDYEDIEMSMKAFEELKIATKNYLATALIGKKSGAIEMKEILNKFKYRVIYNMNNNDLMMCSKDGICIYLENEEWKIKEDRIIH